MMNYFIHELSDVSTSLIGTSTSVWQYVVILPGAKIGNDCNICSHCFIENEVIIGDRVTLKSGVQLWNGLEIGDDVFVGPNVSFSNDLYPRSKKHLEKSLKTIVGNGASIGSGAVILPGITIGSGAMVGAGSVVTRSVPQNAIVVGNPARIVGYAGVDNKLPKIFDSEGTKLGNSIVKGVLTYELDSIEDIRGKLTVGEFNRTVPFPVKRYFMVYDVPSKEIRGAHAHKRCHQFLICAKGSCSVVADDGENRQEFILNRPNFGVYLPPMVWGTQYKYSPDATLLVFASEYYDPDDYIRDYEVFVKLAGVS